MKEVFKNIKGGIVFSFTALLIFCIFGIVYASLSNVEEGDILTSEKWNEMINVVNGLQGTVPSGAVLAFNLDECPVDWLPANGNGSIMGKDIPDLRGKFIRGLNSFENGTNKLSGEDSDIDGIDRELGSLQGDTIRNIMGHTSYMAGGATSGVFSQVDALSGGNFVSGGNKYRSYFNASSVVPTGSDNRPKNIALIYCVKE